MSDPARPRWAAIVAARLAGAGGAIFGVVLLARGVALEQKLLGLAIVAAALWMMAVVPRALARRWRSPE